MESQQNNVAQRLIQKFFQRFMSFFTLYRELVFGRNRRNDGTKALNVASRSILRVPSLPKYDGTSRRNKESNEKPTVSTILTHIELTGHLVDLSRAHPQPTTLMKDRMGWREDTPVGCIYLFTERGLRRAAGGAPLATIFETLRCRSSLPCSAASTPDKNQIVLPSA
jgi:hypothetical protein